MANYTELHVYDFDDTLYDTPAYDESEEHKIMWFKYVLDAIRKNIFDDQKRREKDKQFAGLDIDPSKFSVSKAYLLDLDSNRRYELLYNNNSLPEDLYNRFNNTIRKSYLQRGGKDWPNAGGETKQESYYIKVNWKWYEQPDKSLPQDPSRVIKTTFDQVNNSVNNSSVYTIIMTGRKNNIPGMHARIKDILTELGLKPDELLLADPGSTIKFKIRQITRIMDDNPTISKVRIWEDRITQKNKFEYYLDKLEIDYEINMVNKQQSNLKEFISRTIKYIS